MAPSLLANSILMHGATKTPAHWRGRVNKRASFS
jgi:hypothetical protein